MGMMAHRHSSNSLKSGLLGTTSSSPSTSPSSCGHQHQNHQQNLHHHTNRASRIRCTTKTKFALFLLLLSVLYHILLRALIGEQTTTKISIHHRLSGAVRHYAPPSVVSLMPKDLDDGMEESVEEVENSEENKVANNDLDQPSVETTITKQVIQEHDEEEELLLLVDDDEDEEEEEEDVRQPMPQSTKTPEPIDRPEPKVDEPSQVLQEQEQEKEEQEQEQEEQEEQEQQEQEEQESVEQESEQNDTIEEGLESETQSEVDSSVDHSDDNDDNDNDTEDDQEPRVEHDKFATPPEEEEEEEEEQEEQQQQQQQQEQDQDQEQEEQDQEDEQQTNMLGLGKSSIELLLMHTRRSDGEEAFFGRDDDDIIDEDLENQDETKVKCKEVPSKTACGELAHCLWSSDTRSCRTQPWAMTCDMTQLKRTCRKMRQCLWKSKTKTRGKYCIEREVEEDEASENQSENTGNDSNDNFVKTKAPTIKCRGIDSQEACSQVERCFWKDDSQQCRTQLWAMSCDMTQVKLTCEKIPHCKWTSRYKPRGRYCKDAPEKETKDMKGTDVKGNNDDIEDEESDEEDLEPETPTDPPVLKCRSFGNKESCEAIEKCMWEGKSCKTELWAMSCDMTQVKTTCKKIKGCRWSSKSRDRGKFCKPNPENNRDSASESETTGEEEATKPPTVKCKRISTKSACDQKEKCYWSDDGKGCKTELWAMSCSSTQLKATCIQIPNCTWTAPNENRSRGKYCTSPDKIIPQGATIRVNDTKSQGSDTVEVRIGDQILTLARCKGFNTQLECSKFGHCAWSSNVCRSRDEFLPCLATKLKSKCETLKHCVWSSKKKSRGKYCFDRYFLENPEEMSTTCTKIKEMSECSSQVACEWRSTTKKKGRFCERQVSLGKAQDELRTIFPYMQHGIFQDEDGPGVGSEADDDNDNGDEDTDDEKSEKSDSDSNNNDDDDDGDGDENVSPKLPNFNVTTVKFEQDPHSENDRLGCPTHLECQTPRRLAELFHLDLKAFFKRTNYRIQDCCSLHADFEKMMTSVTSHFDANNFQNWYIDKEFLIGMTRFRGMMPPWQKNAAISVIAKSPRTIRHLMDKFNQNFPYRPYSARACTRTTKKYVDCRALQRVSSSKPVAYYSISHMDDEDSPQILIFPRIIASTAKRCVFLTDGQPVPLSIISPTEVCPVPFYGNIKVRCPRFMHSYLDLKYGKQWREDFLISKQLPAPDWHSQQAKKIQKDGVTPYSSLQEKFYWLKQHHCPTE